MIARRTPATTPGDHYTLATFYARQKGPENYRCALAELDEALRLNPRHYWSAVQRGICHMELKEYLVAAADFGQCIGLWPDFAWSYFNRGCVFNQVGRKAEALADFTAALQRDPRFTPAAFNRGLVSLELKQYAAALDDFDRARTLGWHDAMLQASRGMALEGLKRYKEADAAFAAAFAQAPPRPDPARARLCWSYGFAVSERLPQKARTAFDDVLLQEPNNPHALYGRAMLAAKADAIDEAIATLTRTLTANPGFNDARRSRAVLLARTGDLEHAVQDINWCLEREPGSGDTLYAAACVLALAAQGPAPADTIGQALDLLHRALDHGVETARAAADPDLAALRKNPRFKKLLARFPTVP
jgi:tetratricopeptide (TPR) repeat protein